MKQEIKDRWVKALRSGDYRQCSDRLHIESEGFCCLGVLCDIVKNELNLSVVDDHGVFFYDAEECNLPNSVVEYTELESNNPVIGIIPLSDLNDKDEKSFNEIADLIDQYL